MDIWRLLIACNNRRRQSMENEETTGNMREGLFATPLDSWNGLQIVRDDHWTNIMGCTQNAVSSDWKITTVDDVEV